MTDHLKQALEHLLSAKDDLSLAIDTQDVADLLIPESPASKTANIRHELLGLIFDLEELLSPRQVN
jgi:hypothetical protein